MAVLAVVGVSLAACDKTPAATSAANEAAEPDMPVRKPGLWKQACGWMTALAPIKTCSPITA